MQNIVADIKKDLGEKNKTDLIESYIQELDSLYKELAVNRNPKSKKHKELDKKIKYIQSKVYILRASQLNVK